MITISYESHKKGVKATAHNKCGNITSIIGETKEEAEKNVLEALTAFYDYPIKIKENIPKEYIDSALNLLIPLL